MVEIVRSQSNAFFKKKTRLELAFKNIKGLRVHTK